MLDCADPWGNAWAVLPCWRPSCVAYADLHKRLVCSSQFSCPLISLDVLTPCATYIQQLSGRIILGLRAFSLHVPSLVFTTFLLCTGHVAVFPGRASKFCHCQVGDSRGWFLSSPLFLLIQLPCTGYIPPYTLMITCCSAGSCLAIASFPSPQTLLLFLWRPIQRHKITPQQRGEGAGLQRQFPAVWYHLSPPL